MWLKDGRCFFWRDDATVGEAADGPDGVATDKRAMVVDCCSRGRDIGRRASIAQRYTHVAEEAIAFGTHDRATAETFEECLVVELEEVDERGEGSILVVREHFGVRIMSGAANRTGFEAGIAAEDPVTEAGAEFARDGATILDGVIADTAAGIDDAAIGGDRTSGTGGDAAGAGATALADGLIWREFEAGGNCAEHHPGAKAGHEKHRGFTLPAEAGERGEGAFEKRAVVDGRPCGGAPIVANAAGDAAELLLEDAVIVATVRVGGDAATRNTVIGAAAEVLRTVGDSEEKDGARAIEELTGVGGAVEPLGGNPGHAIKIARRLARKRRFARLLHDAGGRDTDEVEAFIAGELKDGVTVGLGLHAATRQDRRGFRKRGYRGHDVRATNGGWCTRCGRPPGEGSRLPTGRMLDGVHFGAMDVRVRWLCGLLCVAAFAAAACTSGPTAGPTTSASLTPAEVTATIGGLATDSATGAASAPAAPAKIGTYDATGVTRADPSFTALAGAKAEYGQLGDAVYQIEIPDDWNHELVMWAHGFAGFGSQVSVSPPPSAMRAKLIAEGFAWAASSYSQNGYDPGVGADDTLALKLFFEKQHGEATRTYLFGESMGGNVITLSLEHFGGEYDGALAACGALAGEEEIDYLMSWGEVAAYIAGVKLPIGQGQAAMAAAFQQIQSALGPPAQPTEKGLAFQNVMMNLTGGPRSWFQEGIEQQYIVNFGLLLLDPDRESLAGRAATNEGVTYHIGEGFGITDAELNAGVTRIQADASARAKADAAPTTGQISVPLLTLHGTGDLFVPISMEQSYAQKTAAAGTGVLLVQRAIRSAGHCVFSANELGAAWDDLVNWVEHGVKPEGDDLTGDLSDIGKRFTDPLRSGDPGTVTVTNP